MSQEPEDVKPKLNLNIQHEGNRALQELSPFLQANCIIARVDCTVKVKPNMAFKKIFEAAEVCRFIHAVNLS